MEKPVSFENNGATLRGIMHEPAENASGGGVVFLHGWSGCRLGPHRMFVKMARRLSGAGCHCLRFDFRGRGESDGATSDAGIRTMISDAVAARAFMRRYVEKTLFLGICSGGKVAVGAAAEDAESDDLVLWSAEPMGQLRDSGTDSRKTRHALKNYVGKLLSAKTWKKIFTGKVNKSMVSKALFDHERPSEEELRDEAKILAKFCSHKGRILFIYGGNDPATKCAAENYAAFYGKSGIANSFHKIEGANHSFYSLEWEHEVMELTADWVGKV